MTRNKKTLQTAQPHEVADSSSSEEAARQAKIMFEKLSPEDRAKAIQSISVSSFHSYSGPLPSPASLDQYNRIIPDGADRIMKMAENQSSHRIKIEELVIRGQVRESGRGQIFGLILSLLALGSAVVLAFYNHEVVASIIGGTTIVSLASVFVLGKREQKNKLSEKSVESNTQSEVQDQSDD